MREPGLILTTLYHSVIEELQGGSDVVLTNWMSKPHDIKTSRRCSESGTTAQILIHTVFPLKTRTMFFTPVHLVLNIDLQNQYRENNLNRTSKDPSNEHQHREALSQWHCLWYDSRPRALAVTPLYERHLLNFSRVTMLIFSSVSETGYLQGHWSCSAPHDVLSSWRLKSRTVSVHGAVSLPVCQHSPLEVLERPSRLISPQSWFVLCDLASSWLVSINNYTFVCFSALTFSTSWRLFRWCVLYVIYWGYPIMKHTITQYFRYCTKVCVPWWYICYSNPSSFSSLIFIVLCSGRRTLLKRSRLLSGTKEEYKLD